MLRKPGAKIICIAQFDAPQVKLRDKSNDVENPNLLGDRLRGIKESLLAAFRLDCLRLLNCDGQCQLVLRVGSAALVRLDTMA